MAMAIVLLGCVLFITTGVPFLDIIELKTLDLRFKMRGEQPIRDSVVLAAVDEKSLKKEGRWSWPRSVFADLITTLSDQGARVIAFDVGFFEPENTEIVQTLDRVKQKVAQYGRQKDALIGYLEKLKQQKNNDRILARAIRNSEAKIVLGYFFQINPEDAVHISEKEFTVHTTNIKSSRYDLVQVTSGGTQEAVSQVLQQAAAPQSNISQIAAAASYSGYFNKITDPDGVVRKLPLVLSFRNTLYAPLSLKAISAYRKAPLSIQLSPGYGVEDIRVGELSIPVNYRGEMVINFRGGQKTFPHISVTDILQDNIAEDAIRDKIVVVGATAIGLHDECVTPVAKVFPGPEVHLNLIDSILAEDFLYHPVWATLFDLLIILFGGILLAVVLTRTGPLVGSLVAIGMFGGYVWLCHYFFSYQGRILNMTYPLCVFVLVYLALTSYKYFAEEGQKQFIREAFSRYLAPEVVRQLIESPNKLVLGGERREITAFFSDVQGFTSISEKLAPEELVELLNVFLTEITDIILKNKGAVDKFEGDAVIAFFGAPIDLEDHAVKACQCCLEIQNRMVELREIWRKEGKAELKVRIGLFSGPAVVGNMGSRNRMDYTMMGDTVNTAARLEGVNKRYGTYTLIGETTRRQVGDSIEAREIDAVKVVGKDEPVVIYEILGRPGEVGESSQQAAAHYADGLAAYRRQHWQEAISFFEKALEVEEKDGPSQTMIERCRQFQKMPPDENWDGAFVLDSK